MDRDKLEAFFVGLDRSFFLDGEEKIFADQDRPLSIGFEQTISQPSLVLEMTYLLDLNKDCRVLEIGTGSGYQTAFLAEFSKEVYTVERIPELAESAKKRLGDLGYSNIYYKTGDGSEGWKEKAPFDRIIATAAAETMPLELLEQLNKNGLMVIPVGSIYNQILYVVSKDSFGNIHKEEIGFVRFVEMKGKYGWKDTGGYY